MEQIEQTLRLRHRLQSGDENDFNIFSQASLLEALSSVTATITLLLGGIGAVSLLVGGIGIMNIMLVTVTERTKEIGLRKALGAHDRDILQQFLVEALVLTVIGGLAGIGLSFGVAGIVAQIPGSTFRIIISTDAIALALAVSLGSGLIFGLYPAMRATKLDPIEALRYE
jgi:putative ABC transport system permease protein